MCMETESTDGAIYNCLVRVFAFILTIMKVKKSSSLELSLVCKNRFLSLLLT